MSTIFTALYCSGTSLESVPVSVELPGDGTLCFTRGERAEQHPLASLQISSRLGHVPRFIRLPDRALLEIAESDDLADALDTAQPETRLAAVLHALESHSVFAAAATLVVAAATAAALFFGAPLLARHVASAVPASLEKRAGETAFHVLDRSLGVADLSNAEIRQAAQPFSRLAALRSKRAAPVLLFRSMNVPNAFAMPGGPILVSDKLVRLVLKERNGPDLLAAVYAHELAHIDRRHGLQLVLRNSGALLAVAVITGDLSTLTTFSGTLPFLLIQRGYSREFESEADADAVRLLRAAQIDPSALAEVLELLEKQRPEAGPDFTYLSTHPATPERIRLVREMAHPREHAK